MLVGCAQRLPALQVADELCWSCLGVDAAQRQRFALPPSPDMIVDAAGRWPGCEEVDEARIGTWRPATCSASSGLARLQELVAGPERVLLVTGGPGPSCELDPQQEDGDPGASSGGEPATLPPLRLDGEHFASLTVLFCGVAVAAEAGSAVTVDRLRGSLRLLGLRTTARTATAVAARGEEVDGKAPVGELVVAAAMLRGLDASAVTAQGLSRLHLADSVITDVGDRRLQGPAVSGHRALDLVEGADVEIERVRIERVSDEAIRLQRAGRFVLRDSTVRDASRYDLMHGMDGGEEGAVVMVDVDAVRIERSELVGGHRLLDVRHAETFVPGDHGVRLEVVDSGLADSWRVRGDGSVAGAHCLRWWSRAGGTASVELRGNRFRDCTIGSVLLASEGEASHVGAAIEDNEVVASHHQQQWGAGNEPQGGLALRQSGGGSELFAEVLGNRFVELGNADGAVANVALTIEAPAAGPPARADLRIERNRFERPVSVGYGVLAEGPVSAGIAARGNELVRGTVDFPPTGVFDVPGSPVRIRARSGASVVLRLGAEELARPSYEQEPSLVAELRQGATLCLDSEEVVYEADLRVAGDEGSLLELAAAGGSSAAGGIQEAWQARGNRGRLEVVGELATGRVERCTAPSAGDREGER